MRIKSKKKLIQGVTIVIATIIGIAIYVSAGSDNSGKKLSRQLELGKKYLSEEDYERALVAFDEALSIDPKCVDAYLAKAEAYAEIEDYDKSIDTLVAGYCSTNDNEIEKALTIKVEERAEELVNSGQIEEAILFLEDIQEKIGEKFFESLIEELRNTMEVSYGEDGEENLPDSELPYVSIRPLVEAAIIEGKPWYEWDVDSLSEYYGTVYTNDNIFFYDDIENPQYGKYIIEDYIDVWADDGNSHLIYYKKNGSQTYQQYVTFPGHEVANVSIVSYALENNLISCEALIDFYNLSELGLTIDNDIEIGTEYGRVKVIYTSTEQIRRLDFFLCDENVSEGFAGCAFYDDIENEYFCIVFGKWVDSRQ